MGQAKLRGTKDERVAAAEAVEAERQTKRDEAERIEQRRIMERWSKMTAPQKAAALERAKHEVQAQSELTAIFGSETAQALTTLSLLSKLSN